MGSPQQTALAAFTPQFEVHTMTAEALSPTNPMQSLRERLIKEGSIIPSQSNAAISQNFISELASDIKDRLERILSILSESRKRISSLGKYIKEIADKFYGFDLASKSPCSYFSLLSFLNLHRILEVFIKNQDKKIGSFLVVRFGFFFAFKENMKNTP